MKNQPHSIPQRLLAERAKAKLTREQVAQALGVTSKTVQRWEKQTPIPSDKLAALIPLGFDIGYILNGFFENKKDDTMASQPELKIQLNGVQLVMHAHNAPAEGGLMYSAYMLCFGTVLLHVFTHTEPSFNGQVMHFGESRIPLHDGAVLMAQQFFRETHNYVHQRNFCWGARRFVRGAV